MENHRTKWRHIRKFTTEIPNKISSLHWIWKSDWDENWWLRWVIQSLFESNYIKIYDSPVSGTGIRYVMFYLTHSVRKPHDDRCGGVWVFMFIVSSLLRWLSEAPCFFTISNGKNVGLCCWGHPLRAYPRCWFFPVNPKKNRCGSPTSKSRSSGLKTPWLFMAFHGFSWVFMGFHGVHKPFYPNKQNQHIPQINGRGSASPPIPQAGSGWSVKIAIFLCWI